MSRLAAVRPAGATSAQREVIDAIAGGDGAGNGRWRVCSTSAVDWPGRSTPGYIVPIWAWSSSVSVSDCGFTGRCPARRERSQS